MREFSSPRPKRQTIAGCQIEVWPPTSSGGMDVLLIVGEIPTDGQRSGTGSTLALSFSAEEWQQFATLLGFDSHGERERKVQELIDLLAPKDAVPMSSREPEIQNLQTVIDVLVPRG